MGNAIWLLSATPVWILSIPPIAILCLLVGIILAITKRQLGLALFVLPFVFSQVFVTVAGFFRGRISNPEGLMLAFLIIQLLICGILIHRLKESRIAASALTLISLIYALFAAGVAQMSFTNVWL